MQRLIVTVDGPAGSGKSTVARQLAKRLEIEFLNTGAMYRGLTAHAIDRGIDPSHDADAVVELAQRQEMCFNWQTDPPRLMVGGVDVTDRLPDSDVTSHVSDVAALKQVRQVLVEVQRRIGEKHPRLVTEGRDQGSVVFPQAEVKFFLDASLAVRAQRRYDQIREVGHLANLEHIRQSLLSRDHRDLDRVDGPLICPEDAARIDTTEMTLDQVVNLLESKVQQAVSQC